MDFWHSTVAEVSRTLKCYKGSKILRTVTGAQWFEWNGYIHQDPKIKKVKNKVGICHNLGLQQHPNTSHKIADLKEERLWFRMFWCVYFRVFSSCSHFY